MHARLLLLALFFTTGAYAAVPVDISADNLEIEQSKGMATFDGDVRVEHEDMVLTADKLSVFYAGTKNGQVDTSSAIKRIEAIGKVMVIAGKGKDETTVTGDEAVYNPPTKDVVVKGNVVMLRGENVLKGTELRYDMNSRHAVIKGGEKGKKGRVKARFTASSK